MMSTTSATRLASESLDFTKGSLALSRNVPHPNGQPFDGKKYLNYILDFYPTTEDSTNWEVVLLGPKNTPYEGGIFQVKVEIGRNYPFVLPRYPVEFLTPIYHLNIGTGSISDIGQFVEFPHFLLEKDWSPAYTMVHVSYLCMFVMQTSRN